MKSVRSVFVAIALAVGFAGMLQAEEPRPALNDLDLALLEGNHSPITLANENPAALAPIQKSATCYAPATFQYYCKEIWGLSQGRCGANTWRWTQCKQYKDAYGKWFYQECGSLQETCTPPGGAECIPCL